MDPFDARMRFTQQLQHLSASTTSAAKAANFALKHAEYSDDLHSCILEQLERNNMNNRANIMYFLPALCDAAKHAGEFSYVRMMERDILRIIDLVAPDDGSGTANVKVVRQVLQLLRAKSYLKPDTVTELEECIAGRETSDQHASPDHKEHSTVPQAVDTSVPVQDKTASHHKDTSHTTLARPDKRQIEQRIEEDRERHKKSREGRWAVVQTTDDPADDAQFDQMWEQYEELGDDDYVVIVEEAENRTECLQIEKVWTDMPWPIG
ncbi:hypothetical protein AMS68_006367 [Peltaster fructicola]|uniref:CID domain-containing protein n=1 Tax=Peltaster fructicola TaxID=286661 RepID=A0A6H0Y2I8_9PEZI|nr:hypothetical protein AMS68_006367 [Peltaster fructicola]